MRSFYNSKFLISALIIAVSFATYAFTLQNGFVGDDHILIEGNLWIRSFSRIPAFFTSNVHAFLSDKPVTDYYRPMLMVLYTVEYALFGLDPFGWHLVNMAFHAANSFLVFLIASRLLANGGNGKDGAADRIFPAAAALIFATHPMNSEAVSWLAGICDLSYAFFSFLSFYLYMLCFREGGLKKGGTYAYAASAAFFFLATLSKETAVVLPAVLMGFDYCLVKKPGIVKRSLPFWGALALYLTLRAFSLESQILAQPGQVSFFEMVSKALAMAWTYIVKVVWPLDMSFYNVVDAPGPWDARFYLFGAATAGTALAVFFFSRADRRVALLALMAVAPLAPTLAILMKNTDIYYTNLLAERYMYFPMAGISMAAALALKEGSRALGFERAWTPLLAGVLVLVLAFSFLSAKRALDWKDDHTIWKKAVEADPGNYFARSMLASMYASRGLDSMAIEEFRESIRLRPTFTGSHHGLGLLYLNAGLNREAEREFREVLRIYPDNGDAKYNLGLIYMDYGNWVEAISMFVKAKESYRGSRLVRASNSLVVCYVRTGRPEEAVRELMEAYRIDPEDRETLDNIRYLEENFGLRM